MIVAIGHSPSDLPSPDNEEDREDKADEGTEQGELSEADKPGGVMGTISKTVQQRIERFLQMQVTLDEYTQPVLENTADYISERKGKYPPSELRVPAVVKLQTHTVGAAPALTTCLRVDGVS